MQYTSQVPSYFHERDKASHDFSQRIFAGNGNFVDQRGYSTFARSSSLHRYIGYDKETIRQIMHCQDETFRFQVQELHRLYKMQRELMDDITMRQIFMRDLQSQTLSQTQTKNEEKLSLTAIAEEHGSSHPGQLTSGESELDSFRTGDSSGCEKKSKFFIDLNEPLMPEPELLASSSTGSCCLMRIVQDNQNVREEAKSESVKPCGRLEYGIDLNTMPPNSYIDLNVNGENEMEVPLSPDNRRSCQRIIFKDVLPLEPRREGDKVQELDRIAAETLVSIFSSPRSSRHSSGDVIAKDLKSSSNPLSWFADVISSAGDDDQDDSGKEQSEMVNRKSRYPFRAVRNETKRGTQSLKSKRVAARDITQDAQTIKGSKEMGPLRRNSSANARKPPAKLSASYDVKTSTSSELKQPSLRNKQCVLHDWGKIKKRQEGFRRRSKYQVMT